VVRGATDALACGQDDGHGDGVDFHTVLIVVPVPMTPHSYFGVIFL
jgi:hypothetical protein